MSAHKLTWHFTDLMLLKQVIATGSINRAAFLANMSQPALTRRISRLETQLGVKLLDRLPRGVAPTIYSTTLVDHLNVIDLELQRAWNGLEMLRTRTDRRLRLGCTPALLNHLVPASLDLFQSGLKRSSVRVVEQLAAGLLGMLRREELDVAVLGSFETGTPSDLIGITLGEDVVGLFVRNGHPLLECSDLELEEVSRKYPWVMPDTSSSLYRFLEAEFLRRGISLPVSQLEMPSNPAVRWLLGETDRVALTGRQAVEHELRAGTIRRLSGRWAFPPLKIILYRRAGERSTAIDRLIESIKTVASQVLLS